MVSADEMQFHLEACEHGLEVQKGTNLLLDDDGKPKRTGINIIYQKPILLSFFSKF